MDRLSTAISELAQAGLHVAPADGIPGLYTAPGYPELTSNQVFGLAYRVRIGLATLNAMRPAPPLEGS